LAGEQATYRIRDHVEAFGCGEGTRFCVRQLHGAARARRSLWEGTERTSKSRPRGNFLPAFSIYAPSDWTGG